MILCNSDVDKLKFLRVALSTADLCFAVNSLVGVVLTCGLDETVLVFAFGSGAGAGFDFGGFDSLPFQGSSIEDLDFGLEGAV